MIASRVSSSAMGFGAEVASKKEKESYKILDVYKRQMQKRQMTTQEGKNVNVCAVKGNFDDCQNGVKAIFTDKAIADRLAKNNILLSSANSINWGRLAPQIVYYVSTYAELLKNKDVYKRQGISRRFWRRRSIRKAVLSRRM